MCVNRTIEATQTNTTHSHQRGAPKTCCWEKICFCFDIFAQKYCKICKQEQRQRRLPGTMTHLPTFSILLFVLLLLYLADDKSGKAFGPPVVVVITVARKSKQTTPLGLCLVPCVSCLVLPAQPK